MPTINSFICKFCNNPFQVRQNGPSCKNLFCSQKCSTLSRITQVEVSCGNCNKSFMKVLSQVKRSTNHFCSRSCAATYNNKHKKHGTRRSKLEVWLETELIRLYPKLDFHFNQKDTIDSELDIYIPSLQLAFELNGIFHYEPIYGVDKLSSIQNNDTNKFAACQKNNINLCIIDVSGLKYFKPSNVQKYLDIITKVIDENLSNID